MRRLSIFALTAATVIAASGSTLSIQASSRNTACEKLQKDNCIVMGETINSKNNLEDILSQIEKELGNCKWNYCLANIIISCPNLPGSSKPEIEKPEDNEAETDVPEAEQPEDSKPETDAPEAEQPEDSKPETELPDTEANKPEVTKVPEQEDNITETPEDTVDTTFAEQVVKLVNEERTKAGLKEVTLDKNIETAALVRAKEITQSFSHTRLNGSNFSTVLKEQGITYKGAGENIAWGQNSPEEVMKAWMNSQGHRANILNPNFTKIGVGHYQNAKGTNYWAQLFTY